MKTGFLFLIAAIGTTGCAETAEEVAYKKALADEQASYSRQMAAIDKDIEEIKARPKKRQERREQYVKAHPKLAASVRKDIIAGTVTMGMTSDQVRAAYGQDPDNINRSVYSWGVKEQWVYGDQYLYFSDGKLESWQDHEK